MNSRQNPNLQYSDQVAAAVEEIDHLIGAGKFVAGQRLVETDLVEQLGIGRVPIREALRILAGDGVVELMPNRGARVRSYSGRHVAEMLRALTAMLCAGIEEFVESPQYDQGMQKLLKLDSEISRCLQQIDIYGLLEASGQYQQTIFEASGNSYLVELHRRVHFHHYNRQILATVGFMGLSQMASIYVEATQALRARDGVRAAILIRSVLPAAVEVLQKSDAKNPPAGSRKARSRASKAE
jgi:DNA-binding GntR family transcriptional regulator